ncbi:MAG: DRTGG domain-containing protein [bacterium]
MTLREIIEILHCQVLVKEQDLNAKVKAGCGCDLMSDVLAFVKSGALLLTGLNNPQAIRTAEMSDIKVICFVRGKQPNEEMMALARESGITLLATSLPLFEACGRLYMKGLVGCSESDEGK